MSNERILVVDPNEKKQESLRQALEWEGYLVATSSSLAETLRLTRSWNPHLILIDINTPQFCDPSSLVRIRQGPRYTSIIFLSQGSNTDDVIRGLDSGADDYICHPFEDRELLARVRAQLRIKVLHDQLSRANRRLQQLVDTDDLTGLYNMRSLYKKLDQELMRANRYNRDITVLMMDLDNFKMVNDGHDHLFGSFVLSEVGRIIRGCIRNTDFAARYGGDEFLIVLSETQLEGARIFTERLRKQIAEYHFANEDHQKKLTTSIGFAHHRPGSTSINARELVKAADQALYQAKASGKNCVRFIHLVASKELEVG